MQTANETVINVQELEPRLRHQTIFETFDTLQEGESLIIHNNHDPLPVYYQLMDMRGNVFSWEYLQKGPEWWDIRVTRIVPAHLSEGGALVLNVPAIEPKHKHATIFHVFENMAPGEFFIIHNDHDPKPLYYQLLDQHGETFTWEYMEQGPQWWDIRVTINAASAHVFGENETVIDVPSIEPKLKHQTIFHTFGNLNAGESFIIHNNHDPKPVYYQLLDMHGDVFTWEYLQQGPQWWDIRVTRKVAAEQAQSELPTFDIPGANGKEIIINIPSLEPRLKHPTIFKTFDTLQTGESLIIHNDHDPKPVYYQLLGERGDVFTWEYLQQGPHWWDIRVTRKGVDDKETIGQIAAKDLRKAEVFKKYGIDFCCGGKKTVREACAEKGIDATKVEQELQQPVQGGVTSGSLNYDEWNLDFLADYIVNTHHQYVRKYLPEIKAYAAKVAQVHGDSHPELLKINELVVKVDKEMFEHMADEEGKLFPTIKEIVKTKNNNAVYSKVEGQSFSEMVTATEGEHDSVGDAVKEIRELSADFTIPEDACTSYKLLFKMLEEFENDLFIHIHLENNILFPKAEEIEKAIL